MINIPVVLIEIKQDSAVLFERFFANLWSNQSSFWLQRYPLYNSLFGVYLIDPIAGIKAPYFPGELTFIPLLTPLVGSERKPLFKNNNQCLSIAIIKRYRIIKVISIMKNIDHLWTIFIHREFILKIPMGYRRFGNIRHLRPKM